MKSNVGRLFIIVFFAFLSLLLPFLVIQSEFQKSFGLGIKEQTLGAETKNEGLPLRLRIPSINVDAHVEYVGANSAGVMNVPGNTYDVGWYNLGPRPGERGSAVMAGHLDGKLGEKAVFTNLDKLKPGDKIYIDNDRGITTTFMVTGNRIYNPGYADDVFGSNDGSHLNLITCDGVWDGDKKSYSKRLVVFTDMVN